MPTRRVFHCNGVSLLYPSRQTKKPHHGSFATHAVFGFGWFSNKLALELSETVRTNLPQTKVPVVDPCGRTCTFLSRCAQTGSPFPDSGFGGKHGWPAQRPHPSLTHRRSLTQNSSSCYHVPRHEHQLQGASWSHDSAVALMPCPVKPGRGFLQPLRSVKSSNSVNS